MGIYNLKYGTRLMDLLISIHGNVEEELYFEHLIPHKFVTPDSLFEYLSNFKKYLNDNQKLIDANFANESTPYEIVKIQSIKTDLVSMIDYAKSIYDYENSIVPYQELRFKLISGNIPDFIKILNSILASVSYAITKAREGYFHSNVHLILKLLGFEIVSEDMTSKGRIDAVIRFTDIIYIIEFKFGFKEDLSNVALKQIKDNKYADKFLIEHKKVVGIGVSFSSETKNINAFLTEELN